jgi:hypothetical protein
MTSGDSTLKTLLTILTNAAHLTLTDGEEYPSGFWAEEFAVPYQMFKRSSSSICWRGHDNLYNRRSS